MFDHVKQLHGWTMMVCHGYDNKHCKVLTIACCDMQLEDAHAQTLLWENLNAIMLKNEVLKVDFQGFILDSAHRNRNVVRKVYNDDDPTFSLKGHESIGPPIWIK